MTDLILQSDNTSALLRGLSDASQGGKVYDCSYKMGASYPILAKSYREIQSNQAITGAPASQEVVFNLNKGMLLRDLQIKTVYTIAATTNELATPAYGLSIFEYIQHKSNNKVISTITDSYILARVHSSPISKQIAYYRRALPLNPTTYKCATVASDTSKCVFTPVFSIFFDNGVSNNLDLGFYEQQQIVCKFNTTARAGLVQAMTGATCTLWCWTYVPDSKSYDLLRSKNQSPSRPLSMLSWNTFKESVVLTSSTTTTIRLNVTYPVFNTYFFIRDKANTTPANSSPATSWLSDWNTFDFSIGGTKLLESVPRLVGEHESDVTGNGAGVVVIGSTGINPITVQRLGNKVTQLCWGMNPQDRSSNSGALSFNSVNYATITVNYSTDADYAEKELCVVSEYWNLLNLDSSNGSIAISLSN
jgi:hypothetical protein